MKYFAIFVFLAAVFAMQVQAQQYNYGAGSVKLTLPVTLAAGAVIPAGTILPPGTAMPAGTFAG